MKNLSFEEAMKDLEDVVNELESGELTLDKSIEKFKKGIELSNHCNELLEDAEKTVSILIADADGNMNEEDFEA